VKNIEVGIKAQSPDRVWTANLNFFHARYTNFQIQTIEPLATADPNKPPVIRIFPIGEVETTGLEFVGGFRPMRELSFSVNAAYLDAKIKDYPNAACYARQTAAQGCVGGFQTNLSGLSMPNTPKVKINGSARYDVEMPSAPFDASLMLFARYQSKSHSDLFGNPVSNLPAYTIINASVSLKDHDDKYELTLFVNNLFNKKYYASLGDDTQLSVPGFATIPAITATYARDSFRYGGIRLNARF
jgi:iron complex outermembrane receptor protein